jgi:hypothetical protein
MIAKALASVVAVLGSAGLTLVTMIALVRGTILLLSIDELPLRIVAMTLDVIVGTALLLGCIFVATHLAVIILGVGDAEFPPLPQESQTVQPPKN